MKLLIAEDDSFFRNILQQVLGREYELVFANDGDAAWVAMQQPGAPRLAILDWVMPGLSGPQICRKVRSYEAISSMYLILFTARNSEADVVSGLRAGADDYITKPFDAGDLCARLRMGERALEWRDTVEVQSTSIGRALHREKNVFDDLGAWPCERSTEEDSLQAKNCVPGSCDFVSPPELPRELGAVTAYRQSILTLEKLDA
jgi:DNA-binding response OmpR family regulator